MVRQFYVIFIFYTFKDFRLSHVTVQYLYNFSQKIQITKFNCIFKNLVLIAIALYSCHCFILLKKLLMIERLKIH